MDIENYEKHETGGLTVYIPKDGIYAPEGVLIRFCREDGASRLRVEGLKTIPRVVDCHKEVPTSKARRLLPD